LVMWVEPLSNLARWKSLALPVRAFDCVRALPAIAQTISKQQIKTKRLRQ
jgi:hypothetical protein